MIGLALAMREICERLAADTTAARPAQGRCPGRGGGELRPDAVRGRVATPRSVPALRLSALDNLLPARATRTGNRSSVLVKPLSLFFVRLLRLPPIAADANSRLCVRQPHFGRKSTRDQRNPATQRGLREYADRYFDGRIQLSYLRFRGSRIRCEIIASDATHQDLAEGRRRPGTKRPLASTGPPEAPAMHHNRRRSNTRLHQSGPPGCSRSSSPESAGGSAVLARSHRSVEPMPAEPGVQLVGLG